MKIRKKNGSEQNFDLNKIIVAIQKANNSVEGSNRISNEKIREIANTIQTELSNYGTTTVDIVHNKVEEELSKVNYQIAKNYIIYRYEKANKKKFSESEEKIISISQLKNEDVSGDNANKRPTLLAVQRDYISGTMCKTIARKTLSKEIVEAHDKGLIHYHDMDYSPLMKMSNCGLPYIKDIFQNGFMLNDSRIHEPKSFKTACNLLSQITMQVANFQYGGQTESLAQIAKYVDISRQKIKSEVLQDLETFNPSFDKTINEDDLNEVVERRVLKEIKDGIQTYNYQILTLISSNGQTPFCSLALDFNDCETEQEEKDLALIIEEVFKQRMEGIENEQGVKRPVLFPKLLYVTDEGFNMNQNDPYYYLTELAAECVTKTMQPDFISAKISRELKDGIVIKCMGAVDGNQLVSIRNKENESKHITIKKAYEMISNNKMKSNTTAFFDEKSKEYITEVQDVFDWEILSNGKWVKINKLYRNDENCPLKFYKITFGKENQMILTEDHPLHLERGRVKAFDFKIGDKIQSVNGGFETITKVEEVEPVETFDFTTENDMFDLSGIISHNCRSFLTPYYEENVKISSHSIVRNDATKKWVELSTLNKEDRFNNGCKIKEVGEDYVVDKPKTYGRFNQGVITVNLPYVALLSKRENVDFYKQLDEVLEICRKALITRHQSLLGTKAKMAPILWQWGAYLRLEPEDVIDPYLTGDYSTISLGYVGLFETCQALIGESNTSTNGSKLANKIIKYLNDKCNEWKKIDNLPYSLYGTPEEATNEKFNLALRREFGMVKGVTDHDYVTNSYHINPAEEIDAFSKIKFESQFLANSKGGAVSYIEAAPTIKRNIPAVLSLIKYMYNNILYCELNTKLDYCYNCGSTNELNLIQKDGKYIFHCPICGCEDQTKLSGIRRLCGYIGEVAHGIGKNSPNANQGRLGDLHARVIHI